MDDISKSYALEIGRNIKKNREKYNLSQQQLADLLSSYIPKSESKEMRITRDSIAKYERGKVLAPISNLSIIAKALNVSLFDLLPEKYGKEVELVAESSIELFITMMKWINYAWRYNEQERTFTIWTLDEEIDVPVSDIMDLSTKAKDYYEFELDKLIKDWKTRNNGTEN